MKSSVLAVGSAFLALVCFGKSASADALIDAYKKEFAFLEAEKGALKKRISEIDKESAGKVAAAEAEVDRLEQQILAARAKADSIEEELIDVQEQSNSADERSDLLAETIDRAFETLARNGMDVPKSAADSTADQAEQIETIFALSGKLLAKYGAVTSDKGVFFDAGGTQRKGTVVRVGKVAAYGISEEASGALAPAGAGRLKIWQEDAASSAEAVKAGKPLPYLSFFLFESLEKGVEEKKAKTPVEVIRSGGIIAWVIVWLGFAGVAMVLLRVFILIRVSGRTEHIVKRVREAVTQGKIGDAAQACSRSAGSAARVLSAVVNNLDRSREHLEDIVSEAVLHEAPRIERFGSTITVTAAVAPLLGLLGTVTGMISTFDIITEYGTGDPKMLSGGISEALVTTELGLIVAIPMLLVGTLLNGRASSILQSLERAALQVINLAEQPDIKAKREIGGPTQSLKKTEKLVKKKETGPTTEPAMGAAT